LISGRLPDRLRLAAALDPLWLSLADRAPGIPDQATQDVDQDVGVQCAVVGLPAHPALVGDGGDDRQAVALVVHPHPRRLALRRTAAAAHVVAAQPGLVAPVDLGAFDPGARSDHRVLGVQPLLHRCRRRLFGLLHRLLRREAPATEGQAQGANGQFDAAAAVDESGHGLTGPRRVDPLQRVGRAVTDLAV
jgi:hypothetical protein